VYLRSWIWKPGEIPNSSSVAQSLLVITNFK
jgi:hypothetical protein